MRGWGGHGNGESRSSSRRKRSCLWEGKVGAPAWGRVSFCFTLHSMTAVVVKFLSFGATRVNRWSEEGQRAFGQRLPPHATQLLPIPQRTMGRSGAQPPSPSLSSNPYPPHTHIIQYTLHGVMDLYLYTKLRSQTSPFSNT
jgi:hypothetical protein